MAQELLRRNVIIDYRPDAGIRMAPHFYNTEEEIDHAIDTLDESSAKRSKCEKNVPWFVVRGS